jgi:hypothetical protein
MDTVTRDLGDKFRKFKQTTCAAFKTRELRRELDARVRRQNKRTQSAHTQKSTPINSVRTNDPIEPGPSSRPRSMTSTAQNSMPGCDTNDKLHATPQSARLSKTLNLNTYKHHALGDYTSVIRRYGTTDSYSTESVSLCRTFLDLCNVNHSILGRA